MKNAASCEKQCELQNTLIIGILNAHGGLGLRGLNLVRLSVARMNSIAHDKNGLNGRMRAKATVIRARNNLPSLLRQSAYTRYGGYGSIKTNGVSFLIACSPFVPCRKARPGRFSLVGRNPWHVHTVFLTSKSNCRHLEIKWIATCEKLPRRVR